MSNEMSSTCKIRRECKTDRAAGVSSKQRSSAVVVQERSRKSSVETSSVRSHDDVFAQIYDDFWEWRKVNNPEFASNVGDHRFDNQLEDYSINAFAGRQTKVNELLSRLTALQRTSLPEGDRVSYDVLKDMLQTWLDGYNWRFYGPYNPISFLDGIGNKFSSRAGEIIFKVEKDFQNFISRIRKYGDRAIQCIERMNKAIEEGTTYNTVSMAKVDGQLEKITDHISTPTTFAFYEPFNDTLDELFDNGGTNEENRTEMRRQAEENIVYFITKVQTLRDFVSQTYLPNTRADLGVLNLPNGPAYYAACLKWHLSVDLTADAIHEMGLKEVEKVSEKMQEIMKKLKHEGTVKEFFDNLRSNSSFLITNKTETIEILKKIHKEQILPKLKPYFDNIPHLGLEIKMMDYDGPVGIYKDASLDGSRPGRYYANVMSPANNPTFAMASLLVHETDPGHHLQNAYIMASNNIPLFRKVTDFSKYNAVPLHFPFYTAYVEGWALYSEDLGQELQIYKDDYEIMGKYSWEVFRACRMVVDTGIHAKGWTKTQAVEYMLNYTAMARSSLENEVDRYSTWPGQATSYTVGKLKFVELRNRAMDALRPCGNWDIKKFHTVVLEIGPVPLSVLEKVVDDWIMQMKSDDVCAGGATLTVTRFVLLLALLLHMFIRN